MKVIQVLEKAFKMNEMLRDFGLEEKYIALKIRDTRFELKSLNDLSQMKDTYVTEFYDAILNLEMYDLLETSGTFTFKAYEGMPSDEWTADYSIKIIVA